MKSTASLSIFLLLIFLVGCNAQQHTINTLPEEQLLFGSGGGITGASDTYILLKNGQLFHTNSLTKETMELEKIDKKKAIEYFTQVTDDTFSEMEFNHPGNLYYFLECRTGENQNRIVWGSDKEELPDTYKTLYKALVAHLK